jgi:hypothetical protein
MLKIPEPPAYASEPQGKSLEHEHHTLGHLMQWPKVLAPHGSKAARGAGV